MSHGTTAPTIRTPVGVTNVSPDAVYQEGVETPNVAAGWLLVKLLILQGKKFRHPQLSSLCDI